MQPWPDTRDTLLARLQNPADQQAWDEFAELYQPLIYRFARGRGLQDADASDITQRVLWTVARAADRWEPGTDRGRFRGWLARVTTNAVINLVSRQRRHRGSGLSSVWDLLEKTPDDQDGLESAWMHERQCQLFRYAANQVRGHFSEDVWAAFWKTAVENQSSEQVASELGKSIGSVYAARSRVLARLRKTVQNIEDLESLTEVDRRREGDS